MTDGGRTPGGLSPARRRARLFRIAALIVLLLGAVGVGIVYWRGKRAVDLSNDLSMTGYEKSRSRQMEMYYGKQGLVLDQLIDAVERPNTQAAIIIIVAGLLAGGCFHVARLLEVDAGRAGEPAEPAAGGEFP
jgi:hypothetical protein